MIPLVCPFSVAPVIKCPLVLSLIVCSFILKHSDLDVEDDQALDSQMDALPDPVKVAFCMITFGIEDISCFDDNAERRVMFKEGENNFSRQLRFARRLRNAIRKVIDVAVQVVKEIAKVAVEVVNKVNSVLDFIEATMVRIHFLSL